MYVYSESHLLSEADIRSVLGLLDEDYRDLDYSVYVFKSVESALSGMDEFLSSLSKEDRIEYMVDLEESMGLCDMHDGKVFIIEENLLSMCSEARLSRLDNRHVDVLKDIEDPISTLRLHMVYTLLHELRHAWQSEYRGDMFEDWDSVARSDAYMATLPERDADRFASRMMNRLKSDLKGQFKVSADYDWVYGWYHTVR